MSTQLHQLRHVVATCIGKGRLPRASTDSIRTFHCSPSSQDIFGRHDSRVERLHHHAITSFSQHHRVERQPNTSQTPLPIHFSTFTKLEYIHPLSQIVLEHLQLSHGQWVTAMGLDTELKLNEDGTFVLRFLSDVGEALRRKTTKMQWREIPQKNQRASTADQYGESTLF